MVSWDDRRRMEAAAHPRPEARKKTRRWRGVTVAERAKERRGSKEDSEGHEVICMEMSRNSLVVRSEEGWHGRIWGRWCNDGPRTLGRRKGEHLKERGKVNSTAAEARTEEH